MTLFATLFFELGMVIGTILLIELLVLLFRNPYRSRWLRTEISQTASALIMVALSSMTFATFLSGLIGAGLDVFAALPVAVAVPFVAAFVTARLFRFRERLRRADAGENPFHSLDERPAAPLAAHGQGEI